MEEKMNGIPEEMLEDVDGGIAGKKFIKIVNCGRCEVRSSNDATADNVLGYAYPGQHFAFYGWCGKWAKIRYALTTGFVSKQYVVVVE